MSEEEQWEDTYRQQERAGRGEEMLTEVEGRGVLAKAQRRQQRRDLDNQIRDRFTTYIIEITKFFNSDKNRDNDGYPYENYLENREKNNMLIDKFDRLPRKEYRNIYAFILGYIFYESQNDIELINKILNSNIVDINQNISDTDVIRYSRLMYPTEER